MSFGPPVTGSPTQFNGQTLTASSGLITGSSRSQNVTQSFTISASVDAVLDINIFYSSSNGSPKVEWRNGKNSFLLAQFTSASLSGVPTIGGTGSYTASSSRTGARCKTRYSVVGCSVLARGSSTKCL